MRFPYFLALSLVSLLGCSRFPSLSSQPKIILELGEVNDLFFLDAKHGWAAGSDFGGSDHSPCIASTADGGNSWKVTHLNVGKNGNPSMVGVAFRDLMKGWAVGSHQLAFETKDGGETWKEVNSPGSSRDLAYRDGIGCTLLGGPGFDNSGGFFTFSDDLTRGTASGRQQGYRSLAPEGVQILDASNLVGWDTSTLYKSTDAGQSWSVIELPEVRDGSTVDNNKGVRSAFFQSTQKGWLAGSNGQFLVTDDGGLTRTPLVTSGLENLGMTRKLHFLDPQNGVALTEKAVMKTQDGGKSWSLKAELPEGDWTEMFVLDEEHGWVAGRTGKPSTIVAFKPKG